jgi:hypothetical protein
VIALAIAGCSGGVAGKGGDPVLGWEGKPILRVSPEGARVLIGTVKNKGFGKLKVKAQDLRLVDRHGRPIQASIGFVSSFVRSLYPQNGRPGSRPSEYPEAEQRRIGYLAVLRSGESAPLTVSWRKPPRARSATRIVYRTASLPVPPVANPTP